MTSELISFVRGLLIWRRCLSK